MKKSLLYFLVIMCFSLSVSPYAECAVWNGASWGMSIENVKKKTKISIVPIQNLDFKFSVPMSHMGSKVTIAGKNFNTYFNIPATGLNYIYLRYSEHNDPLTHSKVFDSLVSKYGSPIAPKQIKKTGYGGYNETYYWTTKDTYIKFSYMHFWIGNKGFSDTVLIEYSPKNNSSNELL